MGIKSNFNAFLRSVCPQVFVPVSLSQFAYEKIAIDISLFLHKYKAVCGDRWPSAFVNLIASLRRNEIHCVFIFDGKAPIEKDNEHEKRKDSRAKLDQSVQELVDALDRYHETGKISDILRKLYKRRRSPAHVKLVGKRGVGTDDGIDMDWIERKINQKKNQLYSVSSEDFELARNLFDILNVPYYTAPWEAEKMCAKLAIDGKVTAVLSEDTDVIAYGAPLLLTKIDTGKDTCVAISQQDVLDGLELTREEFLDFCIMCGTDYSPNIKKIGSKTAYKHIQKYGSIDVFSESTGIDVSILNHKRVRQLFTKFKDETTAIPKIPYCGQPNYDKFAEFVSENNLPINIERLRPAFVHSQIIILQDENEDEEDEDTTEIILDEE
jgi:5'-3' exonuclease